MNGEILIYTSPGCPDCAALKMWLERRGQPYAEKDLSQPGMAEEAKARCGVRVAPVTVIAGQCLYGTFEQQRPRIEALLAG